MKVFLFGATSPTGQIVLENLLVQSHELKALVRNPSTIATQNRNLKLIKGDAFNPKTFEDELQDCEVGRPCRFFCKASRVY